MEVSQARIVYDAGLRPLMHLRINRHNLPMVLTQDAAGPSSGASNSTDAFCLAVGCWTWTKFTMPLCVLRSEGSATFLQVGTVVLLPFQSYNISVLLNTVVSSS